MAESETLRDVFVDELKDAYDAEKQLIKALRKMSKSALHPDLADAFATHLEETVGQVAILEEVFELLDMKPKGKHCPGIAGIIEEGNEAIEEKDKSPLLDACLVGGGKRAEHYEMAAYQTLIAMAKELGMPEAAGKFAEILQQEMAADRKLEALGAMLLPLANAEGADEEEQDDDEGEQASNSSARSNGARKSSAKKAPAKKSGARKTAAARRR